MSRSLRFLSALFTIILSLTLLIPAKALADDRIDLIKQYLNLVVTGNYESAVSLWTESAQERASRFGIEFSGIPVKIECNSPIIQNIALMRDHLQPPVDKVTGLSSTGYSRLDYSALVKGALVKHSYYVYFDGNYNWLTFPQDYYCREWPTVTSRYFRIRVHPEARNYLNPVLLEEADRFVERVAESLKISNDVLKTIRDKKIEYFYCHTDKQIEQITGQLTKGTYDPASGDIISAFFPHYNRIVQLLIHIKLRHLSLYTLPIIEEGLSVHYGGRWAKAPTAISGLGVFLVNENIVTPDSILTMTGFNDNAGADMAFPVAGLFTSFLLDRIGIEKYLELYLKLSGELKTVSNMNHLAIRKILGETLKINSWEDIKKEFKNHMDKITSENACFLPGTMEKGKEIARGKNFVVYEDKNWFGFELRSNNNPVSGNFLFDPDEQMVGEKSLLFEEHYKGDHPFEGFRYGLRFDVNEAGLYDYVSNHLVAKYIYGLQPSDDFYGDGKKIIKVKLRKDLLQNKVDFNGNTGWLPR